MRMSIIGLQFAGKSTFFQIVTSHGVAGSVSGKKGATIGTVFIPDPRVDKLTEVYHPKKQVNASLEFIDTAALAMAGRGKSFSGQTLDEVKRGDALCLIIREFDSPTAPHPEGSVDGLRDLEFILGEFIVNDYLTLEKRAERLRKQVQINKAPEEVRDLAAVEKALAALEAEKPAREIEFTEQERKYLAAYQLLTLKPLLVVLNVDENQIEAMDARIAEYAGRFPEYTFRAMCAALEHELAEMAPAEAAEFITELGLPEEPAFERIVKGCFEMLGLLVFFTVGPEECHAWPVRRGITAYEAAGTVHSDMQRGFIRAMVLPHDEFAKNPGPDTFKQQAQQQKKDYLVRDGDILEIRFSV